MKFQVAIEYLVILGIALLLLLPVVGLFYTSSVDSRNTANSQLTIIAGQTIVSNAEKVFYQSAGSRLRMELSFPDNIQNISANNNSLVITGLYEGIETDFVFYTIVPLQLGRCTGSYDVNLLLRGGNKQIFVESCGNNVTIYQLE